MVIEILRKKFLLLVLLRKQGVGSKVDHDGRAHPNDLLPIGYLLIVNLKFLLKSSQKM